MLVRLMLCMTAPDIAHGGTTLHFQKEAVMFKRTKSPIFEKPKSSTSETFFRVTEGKTISLCITGYKEKRKKVFNISTSSVNKNMEQWRVGAYCGVTTVILGLAIMTKDQVSLKIECKRNHPCWSKALQDPVPSCMYYSGLCFSGV